MCFMANFSSGIMNKWFKLTFLFFYIWSDIIISVLAFGFYQTSFQFDAQTILDYMIFRKPYNFCTSPIDFLIFTILRTVVLLILILLKCQGEGQWRKNVPVLFMGIVIVHWTFFLIKLLAFSEKVEQLSYVGFWLSCIWNLTTPLLLILLGHFVLCTNISWSYQSLITGETQDSRSLLEHKEEQSRRSTLEHSMRLLAYCKYHWKWFTLGFFFLLIYSSSRVFIPYYTGQVISNVVQSRDFAVLVRSLLLMFALTLVRNTEVLAQLVAAIVQSSSPSSSAISGGLRGGSFEYAAALVNRQMRCDLFSSLVEQEIGFFDAVKTGEITSRLTADCQTMSSTVSLNLNIFLRNSVMLMGSLVFMFTLSWRLSLVTFIAVPIIAFITKIYGGYYDRLSENVQTTIALANHVAEEVLSTMRTVRSFACEKREAKRFQQHLDDTLRLNKKKALAYMGYTWTNEFCDSAILVAVLFYGGHLVLSDKMTADHLISFLLYQLQLGENLYNIGYVFSGLMESVGASRKVFTYMLRKPKVINTGTKKAPISGKLEFDCVSFTYPSRPNNTVLQNVSFTVHPGETVALVGPSGGGKSSIVSLIEHFYECNNGQVLIDGSSVKEYDHEYIHEKIALVAQEPVLYEGTVRYNITYGCDWATEEDMLNAAKMANVHNFIMETEHQYDTNCGEKGVQLSGGQKQRIAIARALIRRPAILILDEATSALDAESEHYVQKAIAQCSKDKTVIVIAHRLSTVEKANRIIVICKGRVVQQGPHDELLSQEGIYRTLVQRQLLGHDSGDVD